MTDIKVKKSLSRVKFLWIGNILLIGIMVALVLHWGDWHTLIGLIVKIKIRWLLAAFFFQVGTYICVALIWHIVLQRFHVTIPHHHLISLSIAKLFFDQTLPSFGVSGSIMAMRGFIRRTNSPHASATTVIVNTTSRFLPYLMLFIVAIFIIWKNDMLNIGLQTLAVIFSIVILVLVLAIPAIMRMIIKGKTPKWIRQFKWFEEVLKTVQKIPRNIFRDWRLWFTAGLLNAVIFLLDISTLWALLSSFGPSPDLWSHAYVTFMIASVTTDLAIVPGKVGVFEGTSIALLHLFKIPIEEAFAVTLLLRAFNYWLPLIPGFLITQREFVRELVHQDHKLN